MQETIEFLQALYANVGHGYAEVRLLHVTGDYRKTKRFWRQMPLGDVDSSAVARLLELNSEYHIYHRMGISRGQNARKSDIIALPALWADVDIAGNAGADTLYNVSPAPSIIVSSGGGWHGYWLLREPMTVDANTLPDIERTLQGIALAVDGDTQCKDVTRILRLPGTRNIKPKYGDESPVCRVVEFLPVLRFEFAQLYERFAPLGAPAQPRVLRHIPLTAASKELPQRAQDYISRGASQGNRNHELFYAARCFNDAGQGQGEAERVLLPRAISDGLPEGEARHTIASAYRYTPNIQLPPVMQARVAAADRALRNRGAGA